MYYGANAPRGYTRPDFNIFMDVLPIKVGSKIYLVVAGYGLGDVWELKAGDSLAARLNAFAETPNPHSAAAAGTGPFYGDRQTFTSSLGSGNAANVTWDFGDSTSDTSVTGGAVKHQYGGVTSLASLPLVRHVTASNAADPTMSDTVDGDSRRTARRASSSRIRHTCSGSRTPALPRRSSPATHSSMRPTARSKATTPIGCSTAPRTRSCRAKPSASAPAAHIRSPSTRITARTAGTGSAITASSDLPLSISPFNYTVRPYVVTVQEPGPASVGDPNAVFTAALRVAGAT